MKLGAFSVSLNVKDLGKSKAFYESLGFEVFAGNIAHNYLIMKNQHAIIGLFQGMFEKNILTFNPGWDMDVKPVADFDDVRAIAERLKEKGIALQHEDHEGESGSGNLTVVDPDGNTILIDQHV